MNDESRASLALSLTPEIGAKTYTLLIKHFGSAVLSWNAREQELIQASLKKNAIASLVEFRKTFDIEDYEQQLKASHVDFIAQSDARYPQLLLDLERPPIGLFAKGNRELLKSEYRISKFETNSNSKNFKNSNLEASETFSSFGFRASDFPSIAVVGTRRTTSYGRQITENLVGELVDARFIIVSGLALGIDAITHKTTIEHSGSTIAVLGCGVDCPNPASNTDLYQQILEHNGLIISEYPLSLPPTPGTFPARNRIIAALSKATLVTEAAADSGSLITADWAQKLGKKVFAVPGPITSKQSDGTAYLLKRGAKFVTQASDILEELNVKSVKISDKKDFLHMNLSEQELTIIALLSHEPLSIDDICKKTKIPIFKLAPLLSAMELAGIVKNQGNKIFAMV